MATSSVVIVLHKLFSVHLPRSLRKERGTQPLRPSEQVLICISPGSAQLFWLEARGNANQ